MKPLAIDLYCGLGGWTDGLLAEDYEVVGFDIEQHRYPARALPDSDAVKVRQAGVDFNNPKAGSSVNRSFNYANECAVRDAPLTGGWVEYPAQLVLQDVRTLHGSQFKDAALIVASPPCQAYSYRAMPWSRAKALPPPDNTLFDACFRIQREASAAAGRHVPLVVENVRGAQKWVGRARWNFGSFYLWGDVPALMPPVSAIKNNGGSWFAVAHNTTSGKGQNLDGRKLPGFRFDGSGRSFQSASVEGVKNGNDWFGSGEECSLQRRHGSKSSGRKMASAMIAKIPLPLSRHIAAVYKT